MVERADAAEAAVLGYIFVLGKLYRLDSDGFLRMEPAIAQPVAARSSIVAYGTTMRSCPLECSARSEPAAAAAVATAAAAVPSQRARRRHSKRGAFTVSQKAAIVRKKREQSWMKLADLAEWFNREFATAAPKLASICEILKQGDKWVGLADAATSDGARNKMKVRRGNVEELDKALLEWYKEEAAGAEPSITNAIILDQAREIAKSLHLPKGFNFSRKWLLLWKKKNGLVKSEKRAGGP